MSVGLDLDANAITITLDHSLAGSTPTDVTLYMDASGNAYRRVYIPVDGASVNRLREQHDAGEIRLTRAALPVDDMRSTEMTWLHGHLDELAKTHPGEWIAIEGDRLVAHAGDLATLLAFSRANGALDPFVTAIPTEPVLRLYV